MSDRTDYRLLLPRQVRELPADLAAVLGLTILTNLSILLPVIRESPVRVVLGLPFVLFIPGYAFIAALFPEAGESPTEAEFDGDEDGGMEDEDAAEGDVGVGVEDGAVEEGVETDTSRSGIDGIERVALSFGLSIAIVPLIGLVLNFTPWGIRLGPILVSVSGFTIGAVIVAAYRRKQVPEPERFRVPYREWVAAGREELFEPDSRTDAALNVLLALSIILALASVGYAVAVPKQGETFTEFYLLTEDEDGELVADGYPTEFVAGESKPVIIGIGNQEHEQTGYTVIVKEQRVTIRNNSTIVTEEVTHSGFQTTLAHNETAHREYQMQPDLTGDRLRWAFLLYNESVPATPTVSNAYRETHLWVNVTAAG